MNAGIPFLDLYLQYQSIKCEVDYAIENVIKSSSYIRGGYVDKFEKTFSELIGTKYCVSCGNGSDALFLAIKSMGVKPGDEVIIPAHSWYSTASMVRHAGADIVFCDTEIDSFLIDASQIESKITAKTVGIIPVHLFGQPADMEQIQAVASKYGLWVIEDCAQAHLAEYKGQQVGTFGDAACFSFYPGKNLGAMGDAGAVVTNSQEIAEKTAKLARHGGLVKGQHEVFGVNSRLDGLQAAVLLAKIPHLKRWNKERQKIAERYHGALMSESHLSIPFLKSERTHVWHLYVLKSSFRGEFLKALDKKQIGYNINYPVALPFLGAHSYLGLNKTDFPNAYRNQKEIFSIPLYPELTRAAQSVIIETLTDCSKDMSRNIKKK